MNLIRDFDLNYTAILLKSSHFSIQSHEIESLNDENMVTMKMDRQVLGVVLAAESISSILRNIP